MAGSTITISAALTCRARHLLSGDAFELHEKKGYSYCLISVTRNFSVWLALYSTTGLLLNFYHFH